jgi:hypothetical protein
MGKLLMVIAGCKFDVHLSVNRHRATSMSAKEYLEKLERLHQKKPIGNDESRDKCILTDTIIELQFSPKRPNDFYFIVGHDLDAILADAVDFLAASE